jgi:hypothetical protein
MSEAEKLLKCDTCGNDYDKAFTVSMPDLAGSMNTNSKKTGTFDSFECAIHAFAPKCAHCGCRIVGHGVEDNGTMFCCASCAKHEGVHGIKDRI